MSLRFVVIDDDISVRRIIQNIIEENKLGLVVGESGDGLAAVTVVEENNPDIVIVDLLLPGQDGVEVIKILQERNISASYIMISESGSQPMITQAYENGIEFFIHKPVNVLEIVSVINKVKESRELKNFMSLISQTTARYAKPAAVETELGSEQKKNRIYKVFSDLGILGEVGAKNIYQMTQLIEPMIQQGDASYQLNDIYQQLSQKIGQDVKTIEQRVRRTITKALQNLANMGADDYYNDRFQAYSTALFDFKEVRQEMTHVHGKSPYHGKINVKKFIEGLLFLAIE